MKPADDFFKKAKEKNVGIIVRVPLASGLLTGKFDTNTTFGKGDHRFFNRKGLFFDKGETFSGIDYETGLNAVEEIKKLFPQDVNLAAIALKWILMFDEVSCVIPGASKTEQVLSNIEALTIPELTDYQVENIQTIYKSKIKPLVHHLW